MHLSRKILLIIILILCFILIFTLNYLFMFVLTAFLPSKLPLILLCFILSVLELCISGAMLLLGIYLPKSINLVFEEEFEDDLPEIQIEEKD